MKKLTESEILGAALEMAECEMMSPPEKPDNSNTKRRPTMKGSEMKEKDLQGLLIKYGLARGVGVMRLNSISRGWVRGYYWWDATGEKMSTGASDLLVFCDGRTYWLEMKRDDKAKSNFKTECAQKRFREWCKRHGISVFRVDSWDAGRHLIDCIVENHFGEV